MTFFLVIDLVLRIFPFFSNIFRMFTMLNVVYDHFLTRKTQFSLCSYFHAHTTTLLLKILGGTNAWAVPHLKFLKGDRPPQSPLGLRPWYRVNRQALEEHSALVVIEYNQKISVGIQ